MQANDRRFSVRRPFEYDWNMKISNVKRSDQGIYKCILLTNPVQVSVVSFSVRGKKGHEFRTFHAIVFLICYNITILPFHNFYVT